MEACMLESNNSGKNIEFMALNLMSRISQHTAAANKADVTYRLVKRLLYGSLPLYRLFTESIIDNSVFRYACYKNDIRNHEWQK